MTPYIAVLLVVTVPAVLFAAKSLSNKESDPNGTKSRVLQVVLKSVAVLAIGLLTGNLFALNSEVEALRKEVDRQEYLVESLYDGNSMPDTPSEDVYFDFAPDIQYYDSPFDGNIKASDIADIFGLPSAKYGQNEQRWVDIAIDWDSYTTANLSDPIDVSFLVDQQHKYQLKVEKQNIKLLPTTSARYVGVSYESSYTAEGEALDESVLDEPHRPNPVGHGFCNSDAIWSVHENLDPIDKEYVACRKVDVWQDGKTVNHREIRLNKELYEKGAQAFLDDAVVTLYVEVKSPINP